MSAEFWAIIGVGVAVSASDGEPTKACAETLTAFTPGLDGVKDRIGNVEQRLARIEGWIAGRFREEAAQS